MKPFFISPEQLAALAAIDDEGSFEGAAYELGVSTSAVSQRIRALEASLGRILVRRGTPSTVTPDGAPVLRHARQQALLAAELADVPRLPAVRFDAKDGLQDLALAAAGLPRAGRGPSVPSPVGFATAVGAGLGWGMLLDPQVAAAPGLVPVPGLAPVERELFWQRWTIGSERLDRLSAAVRAAFPRAPHPRPAHPRTPRDDAPSHPTG